MPSFHSCSTYTTSVFGWTFTSTKGGEYMPDQFETDLIMRELNVTIPENLSPIEANSRLAKLLLPYPHRDTSSVAFEKFMESPETSVEAWTEIVLDMTKHVEAAGYTVATELDELLDNEVFRTYVTKDDVCVILVYDTQMSHKVELISSGLRRHHPIIPGFDRSELMTITSYFPASSAGFLAYMEALVVENDVEPCQVGWYHHFTVEGSDNMGGLNNKHEPCRTDWYHHFTVEGSNNKHPNGGFDSVAHESAGASANAFTSFEFGVDHVVDHTNDSHIDYFDTDIDDKIIDVSTRLETMLAQHEMLLA